jgi:anti-sigma regulatory factor (Ser/Thr protein kinase)
MKENAANTQFTALQRRVSTLTAVDGLCSELRAGVLGGIPKRESFLVELLLREALTNAVCYGIGQALGGEVWCEIERVPGGVAMRIWDPGPGFNWRKHLEQEPASLAESGRGIFLLREYATALRFNEEGNKVEMIRMFNKGNEHAQF